MLASTTLERSSAVASSGCRRSTSSSAGGTKPRLSRGVARGDPRRARSRLVQSTAPLVPRRVGRLRARPCRSRRPDVLREEQANVRRVALELAVRRRLVPGAPRAFRPGRSTARGRAARARRRRRPAAAVPTNAMSSFVGTLAGRRPTARTSGLSAAAQAPPLLAAAARRCGCPSVRHGLRGSASADASDDAGDQPPSVDPRDVQIGGRDRRHLLGVAST